MQRLKKKPTAKRKPTISVVPKSKQNCLRSYSRLRKTINKKRRGDVPLAGQDISSDQGKTGALTFSRERSENGTPGMEGLDGNRT